MEGSPDRNVAQLAASVVAGLNTHINPNVTSRKDMELLNPSRLDIYNFLPKGSRGNPNIPHQNQQRRYGPPQQQQQNYNQPQQVPRAYDNPNFNPIPLPNQPMGYIPMGKEMEGVVKRETTREFAPMVEETSVPVNPSFHNTEFSSPVKVDLSGPTKVDDEKKNLNTTYPESNLSEVKEELRQLKVKVGTLSTRVYKLLTLLEEKEAEDE